MKLTMKVIGFVLTAAVLSLVFTGVTNWIVFNFLDVIGIPEYGHFLLTQIGLALVETLTCLVIIDDAANAIGLAQEVEDIHLRRKGKGLQQDELLLQTGRQRPKRGLHAYQQQF